MNNVRRFACVVSAVPLLFYVYACSSSDSGGGDTTDDDGGTSSGSSGTTSGSSGTSSGSSGTSSGSSGIVDSGTDAPSDAAVSAICVGNPFLASPDAGTPDGGVTADASALSQIVPGTNDGQFLDGPQWVDQDGGAGFLVFAEFQQVTEVRSVLADGGSTGVLRPATAFANGGPTGNAVRGSYILSTSASTTLGGSAILATLPDGGVGPTLALTGLSSPNDLAVAKTGQVYITVPGFQIASGGQGIYQTAADGGAPTLIIDYPGGDEPNGIVISPDGTKLYISFTSSATKRVDSYPISAAGVVGTTATPVVKATQITDLPDGLAVDNAGNIYLAEAIDNSVNGTAVGGEVEVFSPDGKTKLGKIPFATERPTGVAFGGPNKQSLFITVENGVYVYSGRCAGLE